MKHPTFLIRMAMAAICLPLAACGSKGADETGERKQEVQLSITPPDTLHLDYAANASGEIKVAANVPWTAAITQGSEWCAISPAVGSAGDFYATVKAATKNQANDPRYATLTFSAGSDFSKTYAVRQEPNPLDASIPDYDGYTLAWSDEFDGATLNTASWTALNDGSGGGNQELQYYLPANVSVGVEPLSGKSCLVLTAKKQSYSGKTATSGRVEGKRTFLYGRLEASIKLPHTADGLWPAFWLLGGDIATNPWPACGEIDIVEMGHATGIKSGTQNRYFNGACHYLGGSPVENVTHSASLQDDFHLFTLIWDEYNIKMYLDLDKNPAATPYFTLNISNKSAGAAGYYFHKPFYFLFNLAVGGHFPFDGSSTSLQNNISNVTALSSGDAKMYVDFVRVYQR
ncbi:MAG: family 16 glycosylhydrolase [Prevotellaceae bacterium]|jgi:beta-glucanase (GH16 family)|nr:family 16 glycosylhydrolase [Prevotellaceae bacterium]